jgi:hypothetical protein
MVSLSLQTKILSVNLKLNSSSGCSYLCFFEIDGGVDTCFDEVSST